MQIGIEFSLSIHILLSAEMFKGFHKVTSDHIAASAHRNPVVIRRLMSLLRKAELITITPGTGGIQLVRKPEDISLGAIFQAINPTKSGRLFKIHTDTAPACLVGGNIITVLEPYFDEAQRAMEESLNGHSLAELIEKLLAIRSYSPSS